MILSLVSLLGCNENDTDDTNQNNQLFDYDGNNYPTSLVADQIWTTENLRVKTYRDGTPIPFVESQEEWENINTGAWCYVNDDPSTEEVYGLMYNYYAINHPRGLAPEGAKIPSKEDFLHLMSVEGVNGNNNSGYVDFDIFEKLISSEIPWDFNGTTIFGTNSSGYNGKPAGLRLGSDGGFPAFGRYATFGTSTIPAIDNNRAIFYLNSAGGATLSVGFSFRPMDTGTSIRLILE